MAGIGGASIGRPLAELSITLESQLLRTFNTGTDDRCTDSTFIPSAQQALLGTLLDSFDVQG